ncbi:MAG: TfoX/Sxy family protein [Christensenellales bacterium]
MSSTKEYKEFILEQLESTGDVTCRAMMGEYLLYRDKVLFGGIYDDRFMVKITDGNKKYGMAEEAPYDGAKPMYVIPDVEDKRLLKNIVDDTCLTLKK